MKILLCRENDLKLKVGANKWEMARPQGCNFHTEYQASAICLQHTGQTAEAPVWWRSIGTGERC